MRQTQCLAHSSCSIKASSFSVFSTPNRPGKQLPIQGGPLNHPPLGGQPFRLTPTAQLDTAFLLVKQTTEGAKKQYSETCYTLMILRSQRAEKCPRSFYQMLCDLQSLTQHNPRRPWLCYQCLDNTKSPGPQELCFKNKRRHSDPQLPHHGDSGQAPSR